MKVMAFALLVCGAFLDILLNNGAILHVSLGYVAAIARSVAGMFSTLLPTIGS